MTTYLTTEQTRQIALGIDAYWGDSKYINQLCNAAIQSYIDSLAEGLPEPVDSVQTTRYGALMGDYYTRDQVLGCIAKAKQTTERNLNTH